MKFLIVFLFLLGCSHTKQKQDEPKVKQLSCPQPEKVNLTNFPWNDHDDRILNGLVNGGCERKWKELPCVITLVKKGEQDYHVICGTER